MSESSLCSYLTLCTIPILVVLLIYKRRRYPTGPTPWPLLGNALDILWREEPFLYFHELGQKYGGIFTFYFGGTPTVVVTDTQMGVEGLIQKTHEFAGRPPQQALGSTTDGGKDIAFAHYDQNFIIAKKLASAALRKFSTTTRVEETAQRCFHELTEEWDNSTQGFNPRDSLSRLAVAFAMAILTGKQYGLSEKKVVDIHENMYRVETMVMQGLSAELLPFMKYFYKDNDDFTNLDRKLLKEFESVLSDPVLCVDGASTSVAASLLAVAREQVDEILTADRCAHILSDFMAGSNSSMTAAILWVIYYTSSHPHVRHKMYEEVYQILGSEANPTVADRTYMPYIQACINECLRLRPIMPLALRHYTTTDTSLGGHKIPAESDVMFSIYSYHRDPARWTRPHEFIPERWLTDDGNGIINRPAHFMPFGAGARICPGENIARNFIFLIVVSLIQRYDIDFPLGVSYVDRCMSNTFISTAMARDFHICVKKRRQ